MSVFYNQPQQEQTMVGLLNAASSLANHIAQGIAQTSGLSQQDVVYDLTRIKNQRVRNLRDHFKDNYSGQIYLTDHIFHAVRHKPKNSQINFFNMQTVQNGIADSIIVLSNNNVMVDNNLNRFIEFYLNSPNSIFVIWDFDNHHWFALSGMLAACCDLYVPTHADNLEPLSRYNNYMAGPVNSGTIQWTREYLLENRDKILNTERSNEPLGTHIEYPQFPTRQKNLQILHRNLPSVKLVDGSYHSRSMDDRFTEWCSHKAHWIVPVLNDAPIRIFDALITGGVPIIPRSIKYHKDIQKIWDHCLFYDLEDVQNPGPITEKANNLFDERGTQGLLDRHELSLYNFHVDNRVESILEAVQHEFGVNI